MAVLIDTSLLVAIERGESPLDVIGDDQQAISVVSMSELLHGVHRTPPPRRPLRQAVVEQILARFEAIPITGPVARVHAEIWARMASRGSVIGSHDLWIAATALTHDLDVATRNPRDFERVAGLRVLTA